MLLCSGVIRPEMLFRQPPLPPSLAFRMLCGIWINSLCGRSFFFLIHVKAFVQLWQKNMLVDIEGRRLMRACRLCGTKLRGNSDKCAHI